MQRLRTVLLRHARRGDTHLDWMFETPGPGASRGALTTFRVATPWSDWTRLGRIALTPLPPHRRAYLTRQGPVSGGRGFVTRVASGTLDVLDWHMTSGVLALHDPHGRAPIHLKLRTITPDHADLQATALGPVAATR